MKAKIWLKIKLLSGKPFTIAKEEGGFAGSLTSMERLECFVDAKGVERYKLTDKGKLWLRLE